METLLVIAVVLAAVGWIGVKLHRQASGKQTGCSCDGGGKCECGTDLNKACCGNKTTKPQPGNTHTANLLDFNKGGDKS
jgi:hypothetical protein